jgi:hypothetical protein
MAAPGLYAPPPNITVAESLHAIFQHYCSPWKSTLAESDGNMMGRTQTKSTENQLTMDGSSFARMCREAPELDKYIGRTEIDLIFSKTKPQGIRRLDYDHFLDTLLELAVRIYPEEDPTIALANFLSRFIFALFDQPPAQDGEAAVNAILDELMLPDQPPVTQAQEYQPEMHQLSSTSNNHHDIQQHQQAPQQFYPQQTHQRSQFHQSQRSSNGSPTKKDLQRTRFSNY